MSKLGLFPAPKRALKTFKDTDFNSWANFFAVGEIACYLAKSKASATDTTVLVLWCHGNGEDLLDVVPYCDTTAKDLDCFVLSFEYPRYFITPGKPSQTTINENAETYLLDALCDFHISHVEVEACAPLEFAIAFSSPFFLSILASSTLC